MLFWFTVKLPRSTHKIPLPDSWLAAGAVTQTVWNHIFGFPPVYGIQDVDIVYFDADDLSEVSEAERS